MKSGNLPLQIYFDDHFFKFLHSSDHLLIFLLPEVVRTRLREEGNKYTNFFQTLRTVFLEEGYRGLYRGLATQMVRQIPNTALMMSTYEAVVYLLSKSSSQDDDDDDDDY
jgi:hypothetical protein